MINDFKVVVVMPAYNAALTLEQTYRELPFDIAIMVNPDYQYTPKLISAMAGLIAGDFGIGEISCPTRYTAEASSIGGWSVVRYGLGVLRESVRFRLTKMGLISSVYR
jgi:hypothetical protein